MIEEKQHAYYRQAGASLAPAIARLARAMERDPDTARDLEQDIHCELFRSFARFEGQCAIKTWVYRVAHNVAAEHRLRESRRRPTVSLEETDDLPAIGSGENEAAQVHAVARAQEIIRQLPTLDAQVMLLWLEGESAREIAEVTGLAPGAIGTRIHRLKAALAGHFGDPTKRENAT